VGGAEVPGAPLRGAEGAAPARGAPADRQLHRTCAGFAAKRCVSTCETIVGKKNAAFHSTLGSKPARNCGLEAGAQERLRAERATPERPSAAAPLPRSPPARCPGAPGAPPERLGVPSRQLRCTSAQDLLRNAAFLRPQRASRRKMQRF